jgi:squalene-hopene/tetraprenyl-beta-curcumene cyclase
MKHPWFVMLAAGLAMALGAPRFAAGQQPITLNDVAEGLPVISADEPLAGSFSAERAAQYLDRAALNWQKTKKCATCHSNLFYLAARPALVAYPDSGEVRRFYEDYRRVRWQRRLPTEVQGFWPIVVGTGLTLNDVQTTGKLSDVAREVLDILWTVQRADGGWQWPHCDYAPLEIDDHYGATLAALTVGIAPGGYAETPAARAGLDKLRGYFQNNPPKSLHHRAMLAWCSVRVDGIATAQEREQTLRDLLALQLPDGGWSTSGFLTDWKIRRDGQPLATSTSDGYGTGFVLVVARELGVPASDERLARGVQWILTHQRESGKWFTRSPVRDCGNLISNAGSAFAILGLQACGHLPGWPFSTSSPTPR